MESENQGKKKKSSLHAFQKRFCILNDKGSMLTEVRFWREMDWMDREMHLYNQGFGPYIIEP